MTPKRIEFRTGACTSRGFLTMALALAIWAFGASSAAAADDSPANDLYWTAPNGPAWRPRSERSDAKTHAGEWAGERSETDGEPATDSSKRKSRRKGGVEG